MVNKLPAGHQFNKDFYISENFENWTGDENKIE
jgi:hypothetical protein